MSKLEQLIEELCPNGVEYMETKDIKKESFWLMPSTPNYTDSGIPYITSKNIKNGVIDFNDIKYITKKDFEIISSNRKIEKNDMLITMIGTIGEVAFVSDNLQFYGQNIYLIRFNETIVDKKYYYYFITSEKIKNELISKKNASSQGYIKAGNIENLKIPIPPLPVQREIVRILDNFTELTAELTAELEDRKKQYEYYRDSLLTFGDEVEWKKIKDVFQRIKGTSITASKMKEIATDTGEIRIFAGGKTVINAKEKDIENANITKVPSVLVQSRGIIDVLYYEKPFTFKNEMWAYTTNEKITVKYLYYILKKSIYYFRNSASSMGSLPQISLTVTEDYKIPLPPLEEQKRIVDILDRFDTLCNDISKGLPAEIESRQKQYEYYRDKLLSFKEIS